MTTTMTMAMGSSFNPFYPLVLLYAGAICFGIVREVLLHSFVVASFFGFILCIVCAVAVIIGFLLAFGGLLTPTLSFLFPLPLRRFSTFKSPFFD